MTCSRCGNRFMVRNEDKDWECWRCGAVVYTDVVPEGITKEQRRMYINLKAKEAVL